MKRMDKKTSTIIARVIIIVVVLAMLIPTVLSMLM